MEPRSRRLNTRDEAAVEQYMRDLGATRQQISTSSISNARRTGAEAYQQTQEETPSRFVRAAKGYSNLLQPLGQWAVRGQQRAREEAAGKSTSEMDTLKRGGLWNVTPDWIYGSLKNARDIPFEWFIQPAGRATRRRLINTPTSQLADEFEQQYGYKPPNVLGGGITEDERGRLIQLPEAEKERRNTEWREFQLDSEKRIRPKTFWDKVFLGESETIGTPLQESYDDGFSAAKLLNYSDEEADVYARQYVDTPLAKVFSSLDWLDLMILPAGITKPLAGPTKNKLVKGIVSEMAARQAGRFKNFDDTTKIVNILTDEQKVNQEVAEAFASQLAKTTDETQTARILETVYQTSNEVSAGAREVEDVVRGILRTDSDDGVRTYIQRYADRVSPNGYTDDAIDAVARRINAARNADDLVSVTKAIEDFRKELVPNQIVDTVKGMVARAHDLRVAQLAGRSFDELVDSLEKPPADLLKKPKAISQAARDEKLMSQLNDVDSPEVQSKLNRFNNLQAEREALQSALQSSPGKGLMKFTSKKASTGAGGTKGLPEITGEGKNKFSREGDQILSDMGIDADEASKAVEDYQLGKQRLEQLDEEIKASRQELRDELAMQKMTENKIVTESAAKKSQKLDTEIRQEMAKIEEAWLADGYDPDSIVMAPGVLNPDNVKPYQLYKNSFEKWLGSRLTEFDDMHHALRRFMQLNKERFNMRGVDDLYESTVNFYGRRSANIEDVQRWKQTITATIDASAKRAGIDPVEYHKTLSDYQHFRHAEDYNARLGEGAAGIDTDVAKKTVERIEALPYFDEMRQIDEEVMAFHKQTLDLLYDYGMLSDESYRALRTTYKNHVPLQRVLDEDDIAESIAGSGMKVTKTGIYKAVGSEREVKDIFQNIISTREQAIMRTEKNLVMKNLYRFAQENDDLVNAKGDKLFLRLNQKQAQKMRPGKRNNMAEMFIDGKKHFLYINDPHLAAAMIGNNKQNAALNTTIIQASRLTTRLMSSLFTQYNPNFGMPNNIRDVQEAAVYLSSVGEGQVAKKLAGKTIRAEGHKGVLDWIRNKNTPDAKLYNEMRLNGGTSSGTGGLAQLSIDELYDRTEDISKLYHSKPRETAQKALDVVSNWNRIFEDSTRLAVYKAAKESGASPEHAAFLAKKATIDFDQMGTQMPAINALYMFAKVGTVGSIKAMRALRNPKTLAYTSATIAGSVTTVNAMNDMFYPEWRSLVTDYEREGMLPIVLPSRDGGSPTILRIPIAYALRPLKVIADRGYDLATGHETDTSKFMWHVMTSAVSSFNPLGGHDIVSAAVPTALDVPVDIARNKSWTGNSIVSPFETGKSPHLQYYPSLKDTATGRTLVRFTDTLHYATGLSVSPANLMYAIDQYSGGPGTLVDQLASLTSDIASGELPDMKNVPLASSFLRKRDPQEFFSSSEVYAFSKVISRNRADQNHYVSEAAEDIFMQVKTMSPEEKSTTLRYLLANKPDVYKKLVEIAKDEERGYTIEDRNIKSHTIKNGDRARVIYFKVYGLSPEKQKEILADYWTKGILNKEALFQVEYLIEQNKQPEDLIQEPERELIYGETSYINPPVEGVSDYEAAALGVGGALSMKEVNGKLPSKVPKIKGGKAGIIAGIFATVAAAAGKSTPDIAKAAGYTDEVWSQKSVQSAGMSATNGSLIPKKESSAKAVLTVNQELPTSTIIKSIEETNRKSIPKNEVIGLMKAPGVTQGERDIARSILDSFESNNVDGQDFIDRMQMEFLPLTPKKATDITGGTTPGTRKSINLPASEQAGWGWYDEVIYESPIDVEAGDIHYNKNIAPGYFGHVRRTDNLNGDKRRLLETQSDLMQKGGLEEEALRDPKLTTPALTDIYKVLPEAEEIELRRIVDKTTNRRPVSKAEDARYEELRQKGQDILQKQDMEEFEARGKDLERLSPYQKYWLPRILREEVKAAAADGVKKIQIPTGKTAMKIEGLGDNNTWTVSGSDWSVRGSNKLTPDKLRVGMTIDKSTREWEELWMVTDVMEEGQFKAVPKYIWDQQVGKSGEILNDAAKLDVLKDSQFAESFDISSTVNTKHGVYKRYEKEAGNFVKKEYNAKRVTDEFGNDWWEFNVPTDLKKLQINAFGFAEKGPMVAVAGLSGAAMAAKAMSKDEIPEEPGDTGELTWHDDEGNPVTDAGVPINQPTEGGAAPQGKVVRLQPINPEGEKAMEDQVPDELKQPVRDVSKKTGVSINNIVAQIAGESSWDQTREGTSGEIGLVQMMPVAIDAIQDGWNREYKARFGEYNPNDPTHQIYGYGILHDVNKKILNNLGLPNPTEEEMALAHNSPQLAHLYHLKMMDEVINVAGQKKTVREQVAGYMGLLKSNGWRETTTE